MMDDVEKLSVRQAGQYICAGVFVVVVFLFVCLFVFERGLEQPVGVWDWTV